MLANYLLGLPAFEMVAPGPAETEAAFGAFEAFGKGRGHSAGLNFVPAFGYALAKVLGVPLLHNGEDFSQMDLSACWVEPQRAHARQQALATGTRQGLTLQNGDCHVVLGLQV